MINHYVRLGLGFAATADQIRAAYHRKAREAHPDRHGDPEAFRALRVAYETLRTPEQRASYDRALRAYLAEHGAVLCPACGEGNRIPPESLLTCATCGADLPQRPRTTADRAAQIRDRVLDRAAVLGDAAGDRLIAVGDRLVSEVGDLVLDGLDKGIGAIRRRLRLDRRPR